MRPTTRLSLLSLGTSLLAATASAGGGGYQFIDLGTLGGANSSALGLNDAGQVVGWAEIPGCTTTNGFPCKRAFLWENGVMTDLGFLPGDEGSIARAINDAGLVVGNSERDVIAGSGTYHAVTWDAGGITPLVDLGQGTSWADDVNASGTVAGYSTDPGSLRDSVVTWQGGAITNLGLNEPHSYSRGYGLNDGGVVVGFAWDLFQPNDTILFDGSTWTQLGGFGQFQNSEGRDVNNTGVTVGLEAFPSGSWHGAYWSFGASATIDTGVLPGFELSELYDVNDAGVAVGRSYGDAQGLGSRAMLFDGTQLIDINSLLPAGTNALLLDANEINEAGDIVGTALIGNEGHAYLLRRTDSGTSFCMATQNSTGAPASISASGSVSLGDNDLVLQATSVPNTPFLFFYGPAQTLTPLGDGWLCVAGGITRIGAPQVASSHTALKVVDVTAAGLQPGTTNFQCWFRDIAAGGTGNNTSDGVSVTFVP